MIREFDGLPGKKSPKPAPKSLLQSIELHLNQTTAVTKEKAHEAQQLVYDAWEAPTLSQAKKLIARALKLDSTNVDALLHALDYSGLNTEEQIEPLRKIVAIGEKNLGLKVVKDLAGAFWGCIETRPYMRARHRLAEALRQTGSLKQAVVEYQSMLHLNPNDNQGVRYALLTSLLALGRLPEARQLLKKYPETKFSAAFAWSHPLERFLSNDLPGAAKALNVARKQNSHLEPYLTGARPLPRELPDNYAPGSKEEALCFAHDLRTAWSKHPAALQWLKTM